MQPEEPKARPSLSQWIVGVGLVVLLYLLSTGPVTRFCPGVADTIYAPLSPLVQHTVLGHIAQGWLALWGVK